MYPDVEFLEPFLMRRGGQYVAEDGSTARCYADSERTVSTYQWIIDLFRKHRVAPMPGTELGKIFCCNSTHAVLFKNPCCFTTFSVPLKSD
jgi:hypothetical protein